MQHSASNYICDFLVFVLNFLVSSELLVSIGVPLYGWLQKPMASCDVCMFHILVNIFFLVLL